MVHLNPDVTTRTTTVGPPPRVSPTLLISLTPLGVQCAHALGQRLGCQLDNCSAIYNWTDLSSGSDVATAVSSALTELLHIRHGIWESANASGQPQIVIVMSLVELDGQIDRISRLVSELRRELRRSGMDGDIILVAYLGPVGDHRPGPRDRDLLEHLAQLSKSSVIARLVVCTDADTGGRRYFLDDIVASLALQLFYLVSDEGVQRFVRESPPAHLEGRPLALGISRLDVSEVSRRELLREALVKRLLERLVGAEPAAPADPGPELYGEGLYQVAENAFVGSGGSLKAVDNVIAPTVRHWASQVEESRLEQMADSTRHAILALLPPRVPHPPPRPHWFRRLLLWLLALITLGSLPRRHVASLSQQAPLAERTQPQHSEVGMREAETMRLRVCQLIGSCKQSLTVSPSVLPAPWEVFAARLPAVRERWLGCLSDIDQLIWEVRQTMPLKELLMVGRPPQWLRERLEEICLKALDQQRDSLILGGPESVAVARELAAAVRVMFPWTSDCGRRLVLLPEEASGTYQFAGFERVRGRAGEIVFVVVDYDVPLQCLLNEETP